MGIISKFLGRLKKFGGPLEQYGQLPPPWATGEYVKAFGEIGWLYACVDKRAAAVAAANMHLYQVAKNGDQTELFSHPLLALLAKPNPALTGWPPVR